MVQLIVMTRKIKKDPRKKHEYPINRITGSIITSYRYGDPVQFFITDISDTIQSKHHRGKFYEEDELLAILPHIPKNARILDIGANVGNHALFFALFIENSHIKVVEPNHEAGNILNVNIQLNNVSNQIDLGGLGWAISDQQTNGHLQKIPGNLGGTYFVENKTGPIQTIRGDDLCLQSGPLDFIKIDVENMELEVLDSLEVTIARSRPQIFIEILAPQENDFQVWCKKNKYKIKKQFHHPDMTNYLITSNS